ncbi:MAG TPA: tyrosine-type recombinase/integrase [Candidatus Thermoplasmatota archaeon]
MSARIPTIPTFAEAIAMHVRAMRAKRCSARSIDTLTEETARHLADWLERPLASIGRNECALRHEHLSDAAGPWVANRVLQQFRAVYNTAARRFEELPATNPVVAVTFNRVRRRREPIPWGRLPAWRAAVERLRNPVRRDLQLFLLFTGLRSLDARTVRWEHVDLGAGSVHRPRPKGGEERAFTVPLARVVLELLRRRQSGNHALPGFDGDDAGWVFPARDRGGRVTHVVEPKEQRYVPGPGGRLRKVRHLPSPHRLRDTFASAAHEARVHPLDLKVLMNHALPGSGDVTMGYIRPSIEHLRGCVEAVAGFLGERMGTLT